MSTKISDDFMSLEIDILTLRETALYGPQAAKVRRGPGVIARFEPVPAAADPPRLAPPSRHRDVR